MENIFEVKSVNKLIKLNLFNFTNTKRHFQSTLRLFFLQFVKDFELI